MERLSCSNLGGIRRHPDVKWRSADSELKALAANQCRILEAAATMVKRGGVLVYATCSLEPEENEEVILPFLATHLIQSGSLIRLLTSTSSRSHRERSASSPNRPGTDGFTAFRLRKS